MATVKPRSKFITFTYFWQAFAAFYALFCLVVACVAFIAGDGRWVLHLIYVTVGGLWFWVGYLWRDGERSRIETRDLINKM